MVTRAKEMGPAIMGHDGYNIWYDTHIDIAEDHVMEH